MGLIARTLDWIVPERKVAVGATVPLWQDGTPQHQRESYYRFALDGYSRNELVFACIQELATSAAEPSIMAYRLKDGEREKVERHPILDLLERPNPHMDRFLFWASLIVHYHIAGNAYVEIVRSRAGVPVELWPLRPDRMRVIPDRTRFIRGWQYQIGEYTAEIDDRDVIHTRTPNPLDDYYGLPALAVAGQRVDSDNAARAFTAAFFRNGGVPSGLLTIRRAVSEVERRMIQERFRNSLGGPGGWHNVMVLDGGGENGEATYTPMGMPLGDRGLVLPDLDEISEARIAAVFGVPLELIGARLGMIHGNRSTMKEARASFWDETLVPLYRMLAAPLNLKLVPEFGGIDGVEFDMSTVRALQEDQDAKHTRVREDMKAGIISVREARIETGRKPDFETDDILIMADNISPLPADQLDDPPATEGIPVPSNGREPQANGRQNGTTRDLAAAQR